MMSGIILHAMLLEIFKLLVKTVSKLSGVTPASILQSYKGMHQGFSAVHSDKI